MRMWESAKVTECVSIWICEKVRKYKNVRKIENGIMWENIKNVRRREIVKMWEGERMVDCEKVWESKHMRKCTNVRK